MPIGTGLQSRYNTFVNAEGAPFSAQNQIYSFNDTGYDDLSSSGASASGALITGSCFLQPIDGKGGNDAQFLQQGLITMGDFKCFVPSGLQILSNADFVTQAGSYWVLSQHNYTLNNVLVYTKLYVRAKVLV